MDCIDMRSYAESNDGYNWILNIFDCHTKFLFSIPLMNKTGLAILDSLKSIIRLEGAPTIIQTDNGLEFNNSLMKEYLTSLNIVFKRERPRHPQNQFERVNQTITRWLAKSAAERESPRWIDVLDDIVFKYNTSWHSATNISPMMGFRRRTGINPPVFVLEEINQSLYLPEEDDLVEENLNSLNPINLNDSIIDVEYVANYTQRMINDSDIHYHRINFNSGIEVLLSRSFDTNQQTRRRKMDSFYEDGIWIILERIGNDSFKIQKINDLTTIQTVCKNRLKKAQ